MKRHPTLIPLSRQHHQQLLLARLIRNDAPSFKGLPEEKEEKLQYAKTKYSSEIIHHFELENSLFSQLYESKDSKLLNLVRQQMRYQNLLRSAFEKVTKENMDELGRLLEESIRHEERELFQHAQEVFPLGQVTL